MTTEIPKLHETFNPILDVLSNGGKAFFVMY